MEVITCWTERNGASVFSVEICGTGCKIFRVLSPEILGHHVNPKKILLTSKIMLQNFPTQTTQTLNKNIVENRK